LHLDERIPLFTSQALEVFAIIFAQTDGSGHFLLESPVPAGRTSPQMHFFSFSIQRGRDTPQKAHYTRGLIRQQHPRPLEEGSRRSAMAGTDAVARQELVDRISGGEPASEPDEPVVLLCPDFNKQLRRRFFTVPCLLLLR
jgi:hypothetical protein